MDRYATAFVSVLVGMVLTAPFAALIFSELPPIPRQVVGAPPRQVSWEEMIAITECCVVFYAITYFVGRRIYARRARSEDLAELEASSGGHMALLHTFGGSIMVLCPLLEGPAAKPLSAYVSIAIGAVMLISPLFRVVRWIRAKVTRNERRQPDSEASE
jgi:hypothetical protein